MFDFITDLDDFTIVESTNIKSVGKKNHWLVVEFLKGTTYRYPHCSDFYDDLIMADSVGGFFAENIKHQACQRLGDDWPDDWD